MIPLLVASALAVIGALTALWTGYALRRTEARLDESRRARAAAEAASEAKSRFLADMSHEIRTPMNGVIGTIDLLLGSGLDDDQRRHAAIIKRSATNLLGIVNAVLDISKIEASALVLDRCDFRLRQTVEEIVESFAGAARAKGLQLSCMIDAEVPECVCGDSLRLGQILGNLLGNAIKFTDTGEVAVHVGSASAGRFRFEVVDTGIGLSEHSRTRLFEPFAQADASVTRKYGGTGLGLVISRQFVQLMGGELGVDSRVGEGCRFHFTVALGAATSEPPAEIVNVEPKRRHGGARPRVLVADDNETNRLLVGEMLGRLGYASTLVCNGREALGVLETDADVGLVLMDCAMPEMDGYTAAREIRRRVEAGEERAVPVVALTAHSLAGDAEKCRAAGMDDFLSKPVTLAVLGAALERWCGESVLDETTIAGLRRLESPQRPGFVRALVATFLSETRKKVGELGRAVDDGDLAHARALAHAVKGACRNMGARPLGDACDACERAANDGETTTAIAAYRRIVSELDRAEPLLQRIARN